MNGEEQERARELFAQGKSVNFVSKEFGITWQAAKKIQDPNWQEMPAGKPGRRKGPIKPKLKAEVIEMPAAWDLSLTVSADRMDAIFAEFEPGEKADAIAAVLQARLDALVAEPRASEAAD
ncbi:MAG: hypothetical protein JST28_09215 [Acidobacteria bacterium]|nr:hypothetical protein [Acidobacteriota bacterium]